MLFFISLHLSGQNLFSPEIQAIRDRGFLIVAMYEKDVFPFMYHDEEGNFIGHEVELAEKLGEALGVEVRFDRSPQTFEEIIERVANNNADMGISLLSRSLKWARMVRFSTPYITLHPTLLINRVASDQFQLHPDHPLQSLAHTPFILAQKQGTTYRKTAQALFPEAKILEYPEWDMALDAIMDVQQEPQAILRDEISIRRFLAFAPERSLSLQAVPIINPRYADPLAIAVNRDALHLQQWINSYFEKNGVIGTADALMERYGERHE
ncbi:MAG: transporter substrate-binding domain-containing protein [Spirochaetales bacterium]|nr:transporter substrate-binding domain-containing protein [Spirochaetales bacterium]